MRLPYRHKRLPIGGSTRDMPVFLYLDRPRRCGFLHAEQLLSQNRAQFARNRASARWREKNPFTASACGKVLVVGGRAMEDQGDPLASAELFDPTSGTWKPTGSMSQDRKNHTRALLRHRLALMQ